MTFAPAPVGRRGGLYDALLPWLLVIVLLAVIVSLLLRYDVFGTTTTSTAGTKGSGIAATERRVLPPFHALDLTGTNAVSVSVGRTQWIVVHADSNLLHRVTTRVENGTLVIGDLGSYSAVTPMRVAVSVPTLSAVKLSGSGLITLGGVNAREIAITLAGSGAFHASGSVGRLDASLTGSGDAQLDGLVARDVHAVVAGSGRILVHATNSLDASVPGTGAIVFRGDPPHVTTSVTGVGAVIRG
jgi:hypothetical protein